MWAWEGLRLNSGPVLQVGQWDTQEKAGLLAVARGVDLGIRRGLGADRREGDQQGRAPGAGGGAQTTAGEGGAFSVQDCSSKGSIEVACTPHRPLASSWKPSSLHNSPGDPPNSCPHGSHHSLLPSKPTFPKMPPKLVPPAMGGQGVWVIYWGMNLGWCWVNPRPSCQNSAYVPIL